MSRICQGNSAIAIDQEIVRLGALLRERLVDYIPGSTSKYCALSLVSVRKSAYSRVYVFDGVSGDNQKNIRLAVKAYNLEQLELARRQNETLSSLWGVFSDSPYYKIPRPLDFLPELPAIVMEEVKGCSVQKILFSALWQRWKLENALTACRLCGEWLRYFHSMTGMPSGQLDATEKHESLQDGLARLANYGFSLQISKNIEFKTRALVPLLSDQNDKRALVHGDFTVDNVLLDGIKTTGLDIEGRYQNLVYHDMASFLNSIALVGFGIPTTDAIIRACSRAFLVGYLSDSAYNNSALWFLRVTGLVSVALELLGRRACQPLTQFYLRTGLVRLFDGLLAEAPV